MQADIGIIGGSGFYSFFETGYALRGYEQLFVDFLRNPDFVMALFQKLLAQQYAHGEAMHMAATLEIDAVIDPADTRVWLVQGLAGARLRDVAAGFVDTW